MFLSYRYFFKATRAYVRYLPLGLLAGQEVVQNLDNLLEAAQPSTELLLNAGLVVTELCVEILAVGCGAHGGAEDRLD